MKQEKLSQEALFEQAQLQEVRALKEAIDRCDDGVGKEYLWAKLDAVVCGLASRVEGIEKRMRAPASHVAMCKAAAHCTHPDIDATDSMLLTYIAMYADARTGANAHPGNRNIAHALKMTARPADTRIAKNIQRGLIERTARGDGRKNASKYRICWESPFYPDRAPGGEWLVEKPRCLDSVDSENDKPRCAGGADSNKPRCDDSETALQETRNRAAANDKPRCVEPETALSEQHHIISTSETDQKHISIPPAEKTALPETSGQAGGQAGGASVLTSSNPKLAADWETFRKGLPEEIARDSFAGHETEVREQVEKYGAEITNSAVDDWVENRKPPISDLSYKWAVWMKECPPYIQDAVDSVCYTRWHLCHVAVVEMNKQGKQFMASKHAQKGDAELAIMFRDKVSPPENAHVYFDAFESLRARFKAWQATQAGN